eukprot:gene9143-1441_t
MADVPDKETIKNETILRLEELAIVDEEHRIAIMEMVKSGVLSIDEAVAEVKRTRPKVFSKLNYLGCIPALQPKKQDDNALGMIVTTAYSALRKAKQTKVNLIVSTLGISIETSDGEPVQNEAIHDIIYAAPLSSNPKLFGIVSLQSKMGLTFTHLLQASKSETSNQIASAVLDRRATARKQEAQSSKSNGVPVPLTASSKGEISTTMASTTQPDSQDGIDSDTDELLIAAHILPYFGRTPANPQLKGERAMNDALSSLHEKVLQERGPKPKDIAESDASSSVLVISTEGLKIVELASREVVSNIFIKAIAHQQPITSNKLQLYSFIEIDDRREVHNCHFFSVTKKTAKTIYNNIVLAVQEARKRLGNPFRAKGPPSQFISGKLTTCQVSRNLLKPIKAIGAGQFGKVFLATYNEDQQDDGLTVKNSAPTNTTDNESEDGLRAVKLLRNAASDDDVMEFLREAETMLAIGHHFNLIKLKGVVTTRRPFLVVLEYCQYGDLSDVLRACRKKSVNLHLSEQLHLCRQLAAGLQFVSSKGFVHMDVAARNCLIHRNSVLKVGDFGLTHRFDEGKTYYKQKGMLKLSVRWLAIDSFDHKVFSEKSDVWAYGVTLWEIFTYAKQPYHGNKLQEVLKIVRTGHRLSQPNNCPEDLWQLVFSCWNREVRRRPTFRKIITKLGRINEVHHRDAEGQGIRDIGMLLNRNLTEQIKVLTLRPTKPSGK